MDSRRVALLVAFSLIFMPAILLAAQGQLVSDLFKIQFADNGITGLKRVKDVHDTEYIAPGGTIGNLVIRFKSPGDPNWVTASEAKLTGPPAPGKNAVEYWIGTLDPTLAASSVKESSSNNVAQALAALSDGRVPPPGGRGARGAAAAGRGGAAAIPSFTWQGGGDSTQWVQYAFPKAAEVTTIQVYWNVAVTNDPATTVKAPQSWRLLYRDGQDWNEVKPTTPYGVQPDNYNIVSFAPVTTTALRIEAKLAADAPAGLYEWRIGMDDRIVAPLRELAASSSFQLEGGTLLWTLALRNQTGRPVEIGDLAVPLNFAERTPQGRGDIYTQKLIRHSLVAGNGSWVFWQRSNAEGPFLVMIPQGKSKFEYFGSAGVAAGGGMGGGYTPFIHASVSSANPIATGGSWRLPITGLRLAPKGTPGDAVTYAFKFEWAPDFEGVREVLYNNDSFDTNIVPGMTLPIDLPALISLRTKNKITAVGAEFPDKTRVEFVGDKGNGAKVYRVRFSKLGENMITIRYGDGLWGTLEFFVTEPLETLIQKRSSFIVTRMQHSDPTKWYYGAYGDWDQKNKILRNPEDRDGLSTWLVDSCDDAGNARPAYIASKNVFYPNQAEIDSVELYIRKYLWGGMQMTTEEKYPYGIYGIPNWYVNRNSQDTGLRGQAHLWRIYDYPHIIMLYYRMYQIAKYYPDMVHYLDSASYLERAYGTAVAYWTVPMQTDQPPWSANSVGTMNEAFLPELIRALENEGRKTQADKVRGLWESKVERFVNNPPNLFGSEFAFDSTGFESTASFAHYAMDNVLPPGQAALATLPADHFQRQVSYENALKFMDFQLRLNVGDRGWLETSYYQLGSDYRGSMSYLLSYMSHLGGWGVLDYALHFAKEPTNYLRLGYASSLSAWALVNSGTAESGYGYWNPGKENDGAAGGGFVPEAWGRGWIGKQMARGAWYYSAEEDVGYCGALRTHAAIITKDPIFGEFAYGAELTRTGDAVAVIPRDGLRARLHVIRDNQRLHMELARDGFAKEQPVVVSNTLSRIEFTLENRVKNAHVTRLEISGLPAGNYSVTVEGQGQSSQIKGGETSQSVDLTVGTSATARVSIVRAR
jgi:hypothetical protein